MKIKCLLSLGNDNHIIYLNGNSIQHLIQSIQCKSELFNKIRNLGDNVLFEIFDKDFQEFVHLDESTEIENLSRIRVRNSSLNHSHKQPSTSSHHHYVLPCDQNDYLQPPRNHELHKLPLSSTIYDDETVKQEEEEDNRDQDSFSYNQSPLPNLPLTITMKTSEDEDESSTDSDEINYEALNESMNITWSQDAVLSLIESCSKFSDEIASKRVYKVPKESWEKVSQDLKEKGFDYGPNDCQCKFARLRSTYINILCYPNISDHAKWPYYEPIRLLIGTQPIEIRQKEMKFVGKVDKVTKQPKEVKTSEVHVAMIQLVRKYIKDFKNMKKPKSETWAKISQELNQAGFDCTTKTIQGAFHRMRYTFLHLLTTVPNEDDAQAKWPYFYLMQDIDLTPFRLKGKNDYKTFGCDFRRRRRANDNSTATTVSSTLSSENDANSPTFDLLQYDDEDCIIEEEFNSQNNKRNRIEQGLYPVPVQATFKTE